MTKETQTPAVASSIRMNRSAQTVFNSFLLSFVWVHIYNTGTGGIGFIAPEASWVNNNAPPAVRSSLLDTTTTSNEGWHDIHYFVGVPKDLTQLYKPDAVGSQIGQDHVVMQLFNYKLNGFFVDLAANHAVFMSNSFQVEHRLNWTGICVEPNPTYWKDHLHRRCTTVGAVIGEKRMEPIKFVIPKGTRAASAGIEGADFDNQPNSTNNPKGVVENIMYTIPIQEILQRFRAPFKIDYLSLDVEGAEFFVMKGFPFEDYQIRIMTIERPQQALIDLLYQKGYVYLAAFNAWGDETLFAHKGSLATLNRTVVETLHLSNTRLLEVGGSEEGGTQKAPQMIKNPLNRRRFKNMLERQTNTSL